MPEHAGFPDGITYESLFRKKPLSTRIFPINLRRFFPPDDEYATCMARLCILREDLSLEIDGIVAGPFDRLDANSVAWRHNYFFRNSARTLQEISSALQTLNCTPAFKRALKKRWTIAEQNYFKKFCKTMAASSEVVSEVRNCLGGHVRHSVVARGLNTLGFDRSGFWERPFDPMDRLAHTHHPFVNELIIAMLQAGDRAPHHQVRDITEVLEIAEVMARLIHAIPHIDSLFELYVVERQLL